MAFCDADIADALLCVPNRLCFGCGFIAKALRLAIRAFVYLFLFVKAL